MTVAQLREPSGGRRSIALAGTADVPRRGLLGRRGRVRARQDGFELGAAFDEHGDALLGFAINALRERPLAEDCVQETFLRAWRSRLQFDAARSSLRTWLFAIERNVIIDVLRARARTPRFDDADQLDAVAAPGQPDPLERLRLAEAMARLSDDHRDIVVAVHLIGRTYAEFAAETGVPVATLRTRAYHALRALRRHLEDGDAG